MILEVIATNIMDVMRIHQSKAHRIELIERLDLGGLTPNLELVKNALKATQKPIYVMIRPHAEGFVYTDAEFEDILNTVTAFKALGVKGLVFGSLTKAGDIDERQLSSFLERAKGMEITYHRAVDAAADYEKAIEVLSGYGIHRILTSGGKNDAVMGIDAMTKARDFLSAKGIKILAGKGIGAENVMTIVNAGACDEVHVGSSVRDDQDEIDGSKINEIVDLMV